MALKVKKWYNNFMDKKYWLGAIATLGVLDWYCANVKREGTLSQAGREVFHTDTPAGRVAWVGFWAALTSWLIPHVLKAPKHIIDEIS